MLRMTDERSPERSSVCAPAFGPLNYPTKKNGPVWIMGLPLFFAYTVGYDVEARRAQRLNSHSTQHYRGGPTGCA